jgi:hypothetical protein
LEDSSHFTLQRFLERSLQDNLAKESQTIGDALLSKISQTGDAYVIDEIEEHFCSSHDESLPASNAK